jgi:hypothetical protein
VESHLFTCVAENAVENLITDLAYSPITISGIKVHGAIRQLQSHLEKSGRIFFPPFFVGWDYFFHAFFQLSSTLTDITKYHAKLIS